MLPIHETYFMRPLLPVSQRRLYQNLFKPNIEQHEVDQLPRSSSYYPVLLTIHSLNNKHINTNVLPYVIKLWSSRKIKHYQTLFKINIANILLKEYWPVILQYMVENLHSTVCTGTKTHSKQFFFSKQDKSNIVVSLCFAIYLHNCYFTLTTLYAISNINKYYLVTILKI